MGKGSKERLLPVGGRAKFFLNDYLIHCRPGIQKDKGSSSVFLSRNGNQLTRAMINNILNKKLSNINNIAEILFSSGSTGKPKAIVLTHASMMHNLIGIYKQIKFEKNKNYFEYAGASGGYIDFLGYPYCRGRIFDTIEKDYGQYNEEKEVF